MSKKLEILKLIKENPKLTNIEIAREVDSSKRYVQQIRSDSNLPSQIPPGRQPTAWCVNKDGDIPIAWYKREKEDEETVLRHLEDRVPVAKQITPSLKQLDKNVMLEWKLFDHHEGMHSWAKETGADYDLKIARDLMISCAEKIYSEFPDNYTSVIVLGGDNMHADNQYNETAKSKNSLDVDSRYDKALDTIIESTTTAIDIAATNSKNVNIKVLSGNHDHHSAKWLARVLHAYYRLSDHITIDISPRFHKFFQWGKTFFTYVHGHVGTDQAHANFMLNYIIDAQLNPAPKYKRLRVAHLHKKGRQNPPGLVDINGVHIERFSTLAPPEAYAVEAGYSSERASTVTCFHKEHGQQLERDIKIGELV